MRWAGHVARILEMRNAYNILVEKNLKGRGHLEDLGVKGKIILIGTQGNGGGGVD
jgi:hypothetical protein